MKKLVSIAWLLASMLGCGSAHAGGGSTVGNGGSVVIDGKTYRIADLSFIPAEFDRYEFDEELRKQLVSIRDLLAGDPFHAVIARDEGFKEHELFATEVFNPLVEYRLVSALPSNCRFMPSENLPLTATTVPVACTQGKLTYLLPDYFAKLDLLQKALLIIHERLHSIYPDEPYDLKVDVIRALYVLAGRYQSARSAKDASFEFTDEEYQVVRALPLRLNQLRGMQKYKWEMSRNGGFAYSISGTDISMDILSWAQGNVVGNKISIKNSKVFNVQGDRIEVRNASRALNKERRVDVYRSEDVVIDDPGSSVLIENSKGISVIHTDGGITLRDSVDVRLNDVHLGFLELASCYSVEIEGVRFANAGIVQAATTDHLRLKNLRIAPENGIKPGPSLLLSGSRITVEDSIFGGTGQSCSGCNRSVPADRIPHAIVGTDIELINSTLGTALDRSPNFMIAIGTQVSGSSIRIIDGDFEGAAIRGDRLDLRAMGVKSAIRFRNEYSVDLMLSELQGTRLRIDQGWDIGPGRTAKWIDVNVVRSSVKGFVNLPDHLAAVTLEDVQLLGTQPGATLSLLDGTELRNIAELKFERDLLQFGPGKLDGRGGRYRVRKAGFWDRDSVVINSQSALDRWFER